MCLREMGPWCLLLKKENNKARSVRSWITTGLKHLLGSSVRAISELRDMGVLCQIVAGCEHR